MFVCPSHYETFGLTPLEAILAGMLTLVADRPATIGVTDYVAREYRFRPDAAGLADALTPLCAPPGQTCDAWARGNAPLPITTSDHRLP